MTEMATVTAIATDNLVSRNGARYPAVELVALAQLLVGKATVTDHWTMVEQEWGTISRAWVEKVEPPADLDEINRAIVRQEYYQQVRCEISYPADFPLEQDWQVGLKLRVSICAAYQFLRCSGCSCGHHFFSVKCPNSWSEVVYFDRVGVVDAYELSLVVVPAVKEARVLYEVK